MCKAISTRASPNLLKPSEYLLELTQQLRLLLEMGCVVRPPHPSETPDATEIKAQEPETLSLCKVYDATLLLVDFNLDLGQLLPEPLVHRPKQPVMPRKGIYQDHHIQHSQVFCHLTTGEHCQCLNVLWFLFSFFPCRHLSHFSIHFSLSFFFRNILCFYNITNPAFSDLFSAH